MKRTEYLIKYIIRNILSAQNWNLQCQYVYDVFGQMMLDDSNFLHILYSMKQWNLNDGYALDIGSNKYHAYVYCQKVK